MGLEEETKCTLLIHRLQAHLVGGLGDGIGEGVKITCDDVSVEHLGKE